MNNIDGIMQRSLAAFKEYGKTPPTQRAAFLEQIAAQLESRREALVATAHEESRLPLPRLNGELTRTTNQLKMFARLVREGSWVEASIDKGDKDIRKMLVPLGPVVVFGASNFPFAFSTAGGDTASALAAGASVVVKGHSAHARTSEAVFGAVLDAIRESGVPEHTVQHVLGPGSTTGKALVMHPHTTGVGFTGSFSGGRALMRYAAERERPVPVFAEMSSINPVVLLPDTLHKNTAALVKTFAASITLGMGQFCTNPGLLLALESPALEVFLQQLGAEVSQAQAHDMLHSGIADSYAEGVKDMLDQEGIAVVQRGTGVIAKVAAAVFLRNPHFREEVFGPFSLMVVCKDKTEMTAVLENVKGQLTGTVMATEKDLEDHSDIIALQATLAGRVIINDAPTGVEVCNSMVHGGPFPATSDARFTSVGATAIKRWVRPVCFQGFPGHLLPEELQDGNPRKIWRLVNEQWLNT
ncbi:aldehyde dehydrogenase (NADP(+)) [Chitinophaga sp. XS-30]|nr:aldehyde dehydrogenase (NADP(+)) [Chitinophaga sp. XS-30]